jgi:hypothetical protein
MEETRLAASADLPAAKLSKPISTQKLSPQTRADRVRTLDQIKRLYAVMMGLAATHCITEAIVRIQRDHLGLDQIAVIVCHGIIFASLIILFFLGAERYLDKKYLRAGFHNPSWKSLTLDIGCLGLSSVWFVVLGRSVSAPIANLSDYYFVWNLLALYVMDLVILALQYRDISRTTPDCDETRTCAEAYTIWAIVNACCGGAVLLLIFLFAPLMLSRSGDINLTIYTTTGILLIIHLIRFYVDFSKTLEFYYPLEGDRAA